MEATQTADFQTPTVQDLNTNWITEYINENKKYEEFYKENVETIELVLVYINHKNEIISVKREKHILQQNKIQNEELVFLIDKFKRAHFMLLSLLKFNFSIEPEHLIKDKFHPEDYLTEITFTDDIIWKPTINILHDMNSMYFIYKETKPLKESKQNKTRKNRIYLRLNDKYESTPKNTKRKTKHRKTLRKRI